MLHYDSFGPNPRALRMFLLEKKLTFPRSRIDLLGAENRRAPYTERNPGGQLPALELDDGRVIGETVAIFEYLEEKHPNPPLDRPHAPRSAPRPACGSAASSCNITEHLYNGFRYAEGLELFQPRMRVLPEAAEGLKAIVRDKLAWLDALMRASTFVAGDRFTIADIILYCALDFRPRRRPAARPGEHEL